MSRTATFSALLLGATLAGCGEGASRPAPPDPATLVQGGTLYAQHCAACHGTKLEGQSDWRAEMLRNAPRR